MVITFEAVVLSTTNVATLLADSLTPAQLVEAMGMANAALGTTVPIPLVADLVLLAPTTTPGLNFDVPSSSSDLNKAIEEQRERDMDTFLLTVIGVVFVIGVSWTYLYLARCVNLPQQDRAQQPTEASVLLT